MQKFALVRRCLKMPPPNFCSDVEARGNSVASQVPSLHDSVEQECFMSCELLFYKIIAENPASNKKTKML
jgi:hypothetical protein